MLKIQIPTTYKCTLNCCTCIKSQTSNYVRDACSVEQFKKIIQVLPTVKNVDLTPIIGEPLQDDTFLEKLNILDKSNNVLEYDFVTNLVGNPKNNIVDILLRPKIKQVFVSIYGLEEEEYIKYTNTDSDTWKVFSTNLRELLENMIKSDKQLILYFRSDVFKNYKNNSILNLIILLVKLNKVRIDDSTARNNFDWAGRHNNIKYLADMPNRDGICLHAIEQNCIWPNGDVSQCGMIDYNKDMIKGNIFDCIDILYLNKMHKLCINCREYEDGFK